uniref:Uncharacterized protein n=1 Tax=Kalanchoe fedtschenkoi TaxID=63787 RepID=A0A7N0UW01_KALFE
DLRASFRQQDEDGQNDYYKPSGLAATRSLDIQTITAKGNLSSTASADSHNLVTPRTPTFHASTLGIWQAVISYEACVRLCLNAWSRRCPEAQMFLENECAILRDSFGLEKVLLQPEEELLTNHSPALSQELESTSTPKRTAEKIRVQVRKMKVIPDRRASCGMKSVAAKVESACCRLADMHSAFSSEWKFYKKTHFATQARTTKNYACVLRLKSYSEMDTIRVHPGSSESHVFFPESLADDLIIQALDSKGRTLGCAQVPTTSDDMGDRLSWCPLYHEPGHKLVGRLHLHIICENPIDNTHLKCGFVAETLAYDLVMETAMKEQHFHQRNLLLDESWVWLLSEFESYYGISNLYTKLRYVSYVMEVATPTHYCLSLVYDLLLPVYMKGQKRGILSHQENRMLREVEVQLERILALVFENYKSLNESSLSGILDFVMPPSGLAAPALEPAVELYKLLHDISSPEVQTSLCQYFQAAARKRSRRHLSETDEYVSSGREEKSIDSARTHAAYQKMETLCLNIRHEIFTDVEIQNQHILPRFVDLPSLSASLYSTELCNRLRNFLAACPPSAPSSPVAELVIATSDLQRDMSSWGISDIKGGVDSKQLFHSYMLSWIQDTRRASLESCQRDKVKWAGVKTQQATTPFLNKMHNHLMKTLRDFDVIICRWPEYIFPLENAIADIEKEIVASLEMQYADVIAPLEEIIKPRRFSLKYIQKLSQRSVPCYTVSDDLGILLNSVKRMLEVLHPEVEAQIKLWGSCLPGNGSTAPGDRLSEITVLLRSKFRDYTTAIVELLTNNTKLQRTTKLKTILQESKNHTESSEIRSRMDPLINLLTGTIIHLDRVFEPRVFIQVCRVFWNRMGQEVQRFLDTEKESESWYKGSRIIISVLDNLFASQMQHLQADSMEQKDLGAPQSVVEVHNMLSKENKGCI